MVRSGWWVEGVGMKGVQGATEGCTNGSSSILTTNSSPGVRDTHVDTLEGNVLLNMQCI